MLLLNDIASQIERFMMVQVFTSAVVAIVTGLALWWIGVEQPAVWGLAAGIFNSVPYFGPLIVTLGLSLVGFVQFGTIAMALTVASVSLLITTLEGWILTPMLMGRVAQINTVAIFAGLIFWSHDADDTRDVVELDVGSARLVTGSPDHDDD